VAGKNISVMTYFVVGGSENLNSVTLTQSISYSGNKWCHWFEIPHL